MRTGDRPQRRTASVANCSARAEVTLPFRDRLEVLSTTTGADRERPGQQAATYLLCRTAHAANTATTWAAFSREINISELGGCSL